MNTPAHAIVNWHLLKRSMTFVPAWVIVLGAVAPDLPIVIFYAVQKLIYNTPEATIWGDLYFNSSWKIPIEIAHSFVIVGAALILSIALKRKRFIVFFLSMFFHSLFDLPVHHGDAHMHFYPLSDYKFVSPISYWNPAHYGWYFLIFEALLVLGLSHQIRKKHPAQRHRVLLILINIFYFGGLAFAFYTWAT